jgi:AcrR family transcriptional regulator
MPTQAERKAETRDRLLRSAAGLFATKGFDGVSAGTVAAAADRTTGSVYAHFGGKAGMLLALLEERALATGRAMKRALAAGHGHDAGSTATTFSPDEVTALWEGFAEGADHDGAWMLLEHELWLYAARHTDARRTLASRYRRARRVMGRSFAGWAHQRGEVLPSGPERTATLVLALLFGLDMQRRIEPGSVPDDLAEQGLRLLLGRTPPTDPPRRRRTARRKERPGAHRAL